MIFKVTRGIPCEVPTRWVDPISFTISAANSAEAGRVATELARATAFHREAVLGEKVNNYGKERHQQRPEDWAVAATCETGQRTTVPVV